MMHLLIFWIVMLLFWIGDSYYWYKKDHPSFWTMWAFVFLGWTVAHLVEAITEVSR